MKRLNRAHFYRPGAVIALQKKFKDMIAHWQGKHVRFVTRVRSMGNYRSEHILVGYMSAGALHVVTDTLIK